MTTAWYFFTEIYWQVATFAFSLESLLIVKQFFFGYTTTAYKPIDIAYIIPFMAVDVML